MPTAWRLAPYYPTYVPDLPGFGRSQRPPHPFTIPELADALARFMDGVGVERAVLLGNSLGCPITAQFVHAHRDRIQGAIFCSPAGGIYNQPFLKGVSQLLRVLFREPLSLAPVTAGDYLHYGVLPSINLARSMLAQPTIQRIAEMTIPTLIVLGSRDPLVSESRARVIAPRTAARHRGDHRRRSACPQLVPSRAARQRRPLMARGSPYRRRSRRPGPAAGHQPRA